MPDIDRFLKSDAARFRVVVAVRFADLAANQHVNQARYLAYMEEGRLALRRSLDAELGSPPELAWPVAEVTSRYLRAARNPQDILVERMPTSVGRTAFSLGYGLFDSIGCVAVGPTRTVCVRRDDSWPVAIPEPVAKALRRLAPKSCDPRVQYSN